MTTLDEIPFVSSPLNEETLIKFPIESNLRKDLTKMKNTCNNILKMFQDAKSNRDLFDKTINIVNIGNDILLEIQQIIDGSQNSFELKKEIEESPAFQKYSDCISKFETFNQSNPTDEVRREISGLNDELEILTNELRELFNRWKSDRTGWNGKIKKKFKAIAKMASLRKSVSIFEKEIRPYELKLDFIKPIVPSVTVGSKHHITKGFYASTSVAIKVVGNFESGDPKLLELKNEIEFLKNFHNCDHILDVYGFIRQGIICSVVSRWGEYNLQNYLSLNLNLEPAKKLTIAYGIANALNFLHKQKILHYDIRSDNIFLDVLLQAKLYNFRTVKDSPVILTSVNEPTDPRWTPPEKFRGEEYTEASEIYSFSLILWEIINHKTPYHDTAPEEIKTKVLIGIHPIPEATNGTPVEYQKIMEKGWDLSPKQRPTIETMLDILKRLEAAEKFWPSEIARVGDVNNNFLSPNSAIKGDDASSIHTNCSTETDYISPAGFSVPTTHLEKRKFDKFNPFQKDLNCEEAIKLHNQKNYTKAWKIFKEIEKRNSTPETKFWVGYYYLKGYDKGNGGKADPKACKYLYQAAKDGHPDSQYWYSIAILNYGMIAKEQSNEEYFKAANEFLRKAADQNHYSAMKKLGNIIRKGEYGNISNIAVGNDMIRRARTMISQNPKDRPKSSFETRPRNSTIL